MGNIVGPHFWIVVWIAGSLILLWIGAAIRVHHDARLRRQCDSERPREPWGLPGTGE